MTDDDRDTLMRMPPALVKRFVEWLVRQEEEQRRARRRRSVLAHDPVREALERESRR